MKDAVLTFIRAVFWGSLAGGGPFLFITVPIALTAFDPSQPEMMIWIAFMPLVVAGAVVLLATIFFGLPLTALLAYLKKEQPETYVFAGFGVGALLPILLLWDGSGIGSSTLLSLAGAAAGGVTAWIWSGWRKQVVSRSTEAE